MPRHLTTNPAVIQRVLMYTYPAGTIVDAPYTIEQVMGFGKTAVTRQGMTVWTHPDNVDDTADAIDRLIRSGKTPSSRSQVAYVPLRQDEMPQMDELEEVNPDDRGVDLVHGGKVYNDCLILKRKDWDFPAIGSSSPIFPAGKVFCWTGKTLQDEEGQLIELTSQKITDYWNTRYKLTEGYTLVPGGGAEHRVNCAGYALERSEDIETTTANSTLDGSDYQKIATLAGMEKSKIEETLQTLIVDTRYILAQTNHFYRLKRKAADSYILSEKNSSSPVYEKFHTASSLAEFLHGKLNLRLYKRK